MTQFLSYITNHIIFIYSNSFFHFEFQSLGYVGLYRAYALRCGNRINTVGFNKLYIENSAKN